MWSKSRGLDWLLAIAAPPALAKWNDFVGKCLTDRTKVEEETREKLLRNETDFERRKDFFYYLFESKDPETGLGFPLPELWGEAESLIIAGSDTTAVVLTSTFFYLARYPDIQVCFLSVFYLFVQVPSQSQLCYLPKYGRVGKMEPKLISEQPTLGEASE